VSCDSNFGVSFPNQLPPIYTTTAGRQAIEKFISGDYECLLL